MTLKDRILAELERRIAHMGTAPDAIYECESIRTWIEAQPTEPKSGPSELVKEARLAFDPTFDLLTKLADALEASEAKLGKARINLNWFADEYNWTHDSDGVSCYCESSLAVNDGPSIARAALKEIGE